MNGRWHLVFFCDLIFHRSPTIAVRVHRSLPPFSRCVHPISVVGSRRTLCKAPFKPWHFPLTSRSRKRKPALHVFPPLYHKCGLERAPGFGIRVPCAILTVYSFLHVYSLRAYFFLFFPISFPFSSLFLSQSHHPSTASYNQHSIGRGQSRWHTGFAAGQRSDSRRDLMRLSPSSTSSKWRCARQSYVC